MQQCLLFRTAQASNIRQSRPFFRTGKGENHRDKFSLDHSHSTNDTLEFVTLFVTQNLAKVARSKLTLKQTVIDKWKTFLWFCFEKIS
jgi:hypothetical protein